MIPSVKNTDWVQLALLALKANRVPFVWGLPGMGKTARARSDVHEKFWGGDPDAPFVAVAPALSDPTDAAGMLAVIHESVVRLLPEVMKPLIKAGKGTLFIDELTTATQATQAAFLKVVQERVVGDTPLPPDVRIIIAANPPEIAAGGAELVTPLANRVVHLYAKPPEARDWANWLSGALIDSPEARKSAALVGGFVTAKKNLLLALPEDEGKRQGAWPSPRSWHIAADCFAEALKMKEEAIGFDIVAGAVGEACASEFATFVNNMDLPDPRAVLDGRETWKPDIARVDKANVMLRSIASEAVNGPARDKAEREALVEKAWEITSTAVDAGMPDIAYNSASQLQRWRVAKSGAPRAMGVFEAKITPKFFNLQVKLTAGGK
jgi:hypothetical protein